MTGWLYSHAGICEAFEYTERKDTTWQKSEVAYSQTLLSGKTLLPLLFEAFGDRINPCCGPRECRLSCFDIRILPGRNHVRENESGSFSSPGLSLFLGGRVIYLVGPESQRIGS